MVVPNSDRLPDPRCLWKKPAYRRPSTSIEIVSLFGSSSFVSAKNDKFMLAGKPYYFVGTDFWQGMNLGVEGSSGNRDLFIQQLDELKQIGVTNLRIMSSSEGPNTEPFRVVPALMISPGEYDASVQDGLAFLLSEIGKRDHNAVRVLNNFWQWSGGMAQYVS